MSPPTVVFLGSDSLNLNSPIDMRSSTFSAVRGLLRAILTSILILQGRFVIKL